MPRASAAARSLATRAGSPSSRSVSKYAALVWRQPAAADRLLQPARLLVHARRDGRQARRPVVHGVERRHVRQKRLRGTDVRRRLLAPDVLFACLKSHPVGAPSACIHRYADDASGHLPHESLACRKERGMRPAVAERHAKPLGIAHDDVGARLAGWRDHRERQQVRADGHERARLVRPWPRRARDPRARRDRPATGDTRRTRRRQIAWPQGRRRASVRPSISARDASNARTCGKTCSATRSTLASAFLLTRRMQADGLGRGGRFVEQRRVRHVHARQVGDHRLEVEERLEAALRDLRLIRRVRRVPAGIFEHVPLDDGRRDRVVIAEADVAPAHAVLAAIVRRR